jgi:hypothetical protein
VERIRSEQYPWYRRKGWALCSFVIMKCEISLNRLWHSKNIWLFHSFSPISLKEHFTKCPLYSFLISYKIWCRFVALKTDHSFLWRDVETHTSYQRHNFHTVGINYLKSLTGASWNLRRPVFTTIKSHGWLLLSREIKPFRKLHSHTMHLHFIM